MYSYRESCTELFILQGGADVILSDNNGEEGATLDLASDEDKHWKVSVQVSQAAELFAIRRADWRNAERDCPQLSGGELSFRRVCWTDAGSTLVRVGQPKPLSCPALLDSVAVYLLPPSAAPRLPQKKKRVAFAS